MKGKNFAKWGWFREPDYFAGGLYGRPFSLTLQWSWGNYANLDFSAPLLGDCGLGWKSQRWATHPAFGTYGGTGGLSFTRQSWASIDAIEAENARLNALRKKRRLS